MYVWILELQSYISDFVPIPGLNFFDLGGGGNVNLGLVSLIYMLMELLLPILSYPTDLLGSVYIMIFFH